MTINRPTLGVSALIRDGKRLLLVKRAQAPFAGTWSLPGGHVEGGESLADAAAREVQEETGIAATTLRRIDVAEVIAGDRHFVLTIFAGEGRGEPVAGSDAAEARWAGEAELAVLPINDETRALILRHLKERADA
jgi:ADP-ribose pyrophosphatase YjhB (NUDIX family)